MKRLICLFLMVLFLISCCSVASKKMYWPELRRPPREQPIRISIDKDFSLQERIKINNAVDAWEIASSNKVKFIITWNVPKPGQYKNLAPLQPEQGIFIWNLPKDPFHLSEKMMDEMKNLYGLTVFGPGQHSAYVIIYSDVPLNITYEVALHELGHLLGLNHIDGKSVMHKNVKANCITDLDAKQLCELYNCQPKPNCD